jgi:hypothetical protein
MHRNAGNRTFYCTVPWSEETTLHAGWRLGWCWEPTRALKPSLKRGGRPSTNGNIARLCCNAEPGTRAGSGDFQSPTAISSRRVSALESSGCLAAVAFGVGVSHPQCRFSVSTSNRPDHFEAAMLLCKDCPYRDGSRQHSTRNLNRRGHLRE